MPVIKRAGVAAKEVKTGFESFDGPEPTKSGMYRAKIVSTKYKRFKANEEGLQNEGLVVSIVLEAHKGDPKKHAQFDGWPKTTNLVFGDKQMMIDRESNFYAALGVKDSPSINTEAGDIEQGVKVTKIGGKAPVGCYVNVDLKPDRNPAYGMTIDGIYKVRDGVKFEASDEEEPDEDEDLLEEDEESEEEEAAGDEEYEARQEELGGMTIPALRKLAKDDYEVDTAGLKKQELIDAILDVEFEVEEEDDEDEDDEEEDEDEDDEEVEEDEQDARREELSELTRVQLKSILRKLDPAVKVLQKTTDEQLVDTILALEFETPF